MDHYKLIFTLSLLFLCSTAFAIEIHVDFDSTRYAIDPMAWGINAFKATDPVHTENPQYLNGLRYLLGSGPKRGIVRVHTWEMMGNNEGSWLGNDAGGWNAAKAIRSIKALIDDGFEVCINIPAAPNDDNVQNKELFASSSAALVKHLNQTGHLDIRCWEVLNERDDVIADPNLLADRYLAAHDSMIKVDGSIQIGGPAFQHAYRTNYMNTFLDRCIDKMDFVSFHVYGGDGTVADELLWNSAGAGWLLSSVIAEVKKRSQGRDIPVWHNEYNISWTWQTGIEQMKGMSGAIYDALVMARNLDLGARWLSAWNEQDGSYGKMDNNYLYRPAAHVFHLFNQYLKGNRVHTVSSKTDSVVVFATRDSTRLQSILMINKTMVAQSIRINIKGEVGSRWNGWQLVNSEFQSLLNPSPLTLVGIPPMSVTVLVQGSDEIATGVLERIPGKSPVQKRINFDFLGRKSRLP